MPHFKPFLETQKDEIRPLKYICVGFTHTFLIFKLKKINLTQSDEGFLLYIQLEKVVVELYSKNCLKTIVSFDTIENS